MSKKERILKLIKSGKSIGEVAKAVKVKPAYVYYTRWLDLNKGKLKKAKKTSKPSRIIETARITKAELDALLPKPDLVNKPPHYRAGGIDFIDFAEAKGLTENAYLFNVVKYVVRCGRKEDADPVQDLEKAQFYLKREIERRKHA